MSDNKYKALFDKANLDAKTKDRIEDKVYILKFKMEVGTEEEHAIDFTVNQFWGHVDIRVDGKLYLHRKLKGVLFKQSWIFEIQVGNVEKNDIKIELVKSLFPVGLRECTAWVYINGEKTNEFTGRFELSNMFSGWINPKVKRAILILFLSFAAVLVTSMVAGLIYNWPIKIDKSINGILYRAGNSEYIEERTLVIDGHYSRRIFKSDEFFGTFYIEGIELDESIDLTDASILFGSKMGGQLYYFDNRTNSGSGIITLGSVFMDARGDKVVVNIFDNFMNNYKTWNSGDGLIFAAPAEDRKQAVDITNELMSELLIKDIE